MSDLSQTLADLRAAIRGADDAVPCTIGAGLLRRLLGALEDRSAQRNARAAPIAAREVADPGRLAEIRARVEAATTGPWFLVPLPWRRRDAPSYVTTRDEDPHAGRPVFMPWECEEFSDEFTEDDWINQADADLDFAAHAREDIPWLLDELAKAQAPAPARTETEGTA